ncbi:ABC transporter ATP-binding protein [Rhizobium sp. L1K21]|uniref:ABC transporter ATP-binding protein n=1 Tax=Rhizobium sp. L1K21 TaxID=2954933 RepID=UPI0020935F06|nr:ABC transporter ATP-binding protein [Rhizobium sp. L1K21]MCO6188509.1 ABC transporter ATP-binding protein [Rhizobium sp. L1K21]
MLSCSSLTVTYGQRKALDGFDLSLQPGEVRALIGPNGSGKSTALQAIAGLTKPTKGSITINGKSIAKLSRRQIAKELAFLPQQPVAPDEISVIELVRQGRFAHVGLLGRYTSRDEDAIHWALENTGLSDFATRPLRELSGGERQRAWIAAALAQEAEILLLDEPTTYLDIGFQVEVIDLVYRLSREKNVAVVMSIHDLNQAMAICDRISLLKHGQLMFDGEPNDLAQSDLIEEVFRVKGHFVPITPYAPPHFDVELARRGTVITTELRSC